MGSSLYGFGSVDAAGSPVQTILIDGNKGIGRNARKIDERTGQYAFDANGRIAGMSEVQQAVLLAVKTVRGSSAIKDFGDPSGLIQRKGTNYQKQLASALTLALKDLTDRQMIRIDSVNVTDNGGPVLRVLRFTDLTTNVASALTI